MESNAFNKMSQNEKLRAMEALWDALTHGESEPPSPTWHEEILASRRAKMEAGEATFVTLEELKTKPAE
jgi:hypothetical protein